MPIKLASCFDPYHTYEDVRVLVDLLEVLYYLYWHRRRNAKNVTRLRQNREGSGYICVGRRVDPYMVICIWFICSVCLADSIKHNKGCGTTRLIRRLLV